MFFCRVKKYGAGDKIPKHRYGVYSKEWPLEREKIISETRTKLQTAFTKSQWEMMRNRRHCGSMDSLLKPVKEKSDKGLLANENSYKSVSKMLLNIHGGIKNNVQQPTKSTGILEPKMKTEALESSGTLMCTNKYKVNENRNQYRILTQGDRLNEKKLYWNTCRRFSKNLPSNIIN